MGDLAGVRIGLYFPDDVPRVAQKIEEHFDRKWLLDTVTGWGDAIKGRNMDIQKYLDGRWCSSLLYNSLFSVGIEIFQISPFCRICP